MLNKSVFRFFVKSQKYSVYITLHTLHYAHYTLHPIKMEKCVPAELVASKHCSVLVESHLFSEVLRHIRSCSLHRPAVVGPSSSLTEIKNNFFKIFKKIEPPNIVILVQEFIFVF